MAKSKALLLSIRSPCLAEGKELEARWDWTVLRVKQEIGKVWDDHPSPNDQRLIHSGKLLENSSLLKDSLRIDEDSTHYTVYLVRRHDASVGATPQKQQQGASSEGLRKRNFQQQQQLPQQPEPSSVNHWQAYLQQFSEHGSSTGEQHSAMIHQMYAHYMNHYMQYWRYHSSGAPQQQQQQTTAAFQHHYDQLVQGGGLNPMAAAAAAAALVGQPQVTVPQHFNAPEARQPEVNMAPEVGNNLGVGGGNAVMNAGAGAVGAMEEEEMEGGQRDILDWIYVAMRVIVLFSVVYFYSSLARFALVAGVGLAVYLYRSGLFGGGQRMNQEPNLDNNPDNGEVAAGEEDSYADGDNAAIEDAEPRRSWHSMAYTFVTTFFTSLMPNEPQAVV